MIRKVRLLWTIFFTFTIVVITAVCILTIQNGVKNIIIERNYMLQNETLGRKASMVSNCFDNGRIILRKNTEIIRSMMETTDIEEDILYNFDDDFFDRVLYVTPKAEVIGGLEGYTKDFIVALEGIYQGKEDIVALKNGDTYIFVFVSPMYIGDQPSGAILGLYGNNHIDDMLTDVHSGTPSRDLVTFSDGTAIANSEGAKNLNEGMSITNILGNEAKNSFYSEEEYKKVIDNMKNPSVKSFNYRMRGSSGVTLVGVVRIDSTPFLITQYLYSKETTEMQVEENVRYTNLMIIVIVCFLFFMVLMQIYNAKKQSILEKQAKLDNMTGLLNHNASIEAIENVLSNNNCGAVLVLDIDEFKTINDTYGHLFGDNVVKSVSRCICDIFSDDEILGRFGGDEFIIYIPNECNKTFVLKKAHRLLNALNGFYFSNGCAISGSIGITVHQGGETGVIELIKKADEAMYHAKNKGKNQYVLYDEESDLIRRY